MTNLTFNPNSDCYPQLQVGNIYLYLYNLNQTICPSLTAGAAYYSGFHFLLAPHFKYVKDKM